MIVRWGLDALEPLLRELRLERPLLISSARWAGLELPVAERFHGVKPHAEIDSVGEATERAHHADALVALGGGSAIDTAKAVGAATGLPVVAVPTTYSGAEWTDYFGMRDPQRGVKRGGSGKRPVAIVYEPKLTLDLPRGASGGTALNALAHCAEALYVAGRNAEGDEHALAGARRIAQSLPQVLANGHELEARTTLLRGAMHAGAALGEAGLGLGHAMAQALGGRYGIPHGAANALCLPPALRFNGPAVPEAIARFGQAIGADDPAARAEELARLAGFERLRDLGVPEDGLEEVAQATAARAGARANPRPATAEQIAELLRTIW
ncbi:MAG TPA: iron-containing alcohol dehydrogenase [Gaiellaceae bacterium]|nr:iron-containing alcohol dehydrogenase [Gaiellaceae bacterium]